MAKFEGEENVSFLKRESIHYVQLFKKPKNQIQIDLY